jgi:aldehyde:ferredoxin oxidoreductase
LLLWKCRKQAFGAVGRLAPSYCTQDGVVPRTKLPQMLPEYYQLRGWTPDGKPQADTLARLGLA